MKAFVHPRLWLAVWVLASVVLVGGSLIDPPDAAGVPGNDKVLHLVTYLLVAVLGVQVFRGRRRALAAALYLVVLGLVLEVAQGTLTSDRVMDGRDALANTVGVLLGLATTLLPGQDLLLRAERRWVAAHAAP